MANLRKHQHELLYPNGSSALLFGTEYTRFLTLTTPQIAVADGILGDVDRPREDGRAFGEDYIGAKTMTFEIGVLTDRHGYADVHVANHDTINEFETVWRDPRFRSGPGKIGVLRSNQAGTTYRCYGRPRLYEEATGAFTDQGYTPIVAEFALVDGHWYSDTEQQASCRIVPPTNPGLIGPLVAPLSTVAATSASTFMDVGGTEATWPVITIHGPITNPSVQIGTLFVELSGHVDWDRPVTIDPRPWARTVLRADGASMAGSLTARTPMMRQMRLQPGSYELIFRGQDDTGTARCEVTWRDARNRP